MLNIDLQNEIACHYKSHSFSTEWWKQSSNNYAQKFDSFFSSSQGVFVLEPAGHLSIRNVNFGAISSKHLFGLDELIIFSWYATNATRYKRTLDLGGNIGIHSLVMNKLGLNVVAYEPDPIHIGQFKETIKDNTCVGIELRERAISTSTGNVQFTRVLGNTTGSHILGAKDKPYGNLEVIEIEVDAIQEVLEENFDFVKMDVEGHEADIIEALNHGSFEKMEMMLEIGTAQNAKRIFGQIERLEVNAFSQKTNWKKVIQLNDFPTSHREGSVFLTKSPEMAWTNK